MKEVKWRPDQWEDYNKSQNQDEKEKMISEWGCPLELIPVKKQSEEAILKEKINIILDTLNENDLEKILDNAEYIQSKTE